MPEYFELWPLFVFLAMLVGFAAERASICTVKAVEELMTSKRAFYFLSFAKTVLWAAGISILLIWWFGVDPVTDFGFKIVIPGLVGGFLFGVGAVLNNGCAFSTINRLGGGNAGMLMTLIGFVIGIALHTLAIGHVPSAAAIRSEPWLALDTTAIRVLGTVLALWMLWEFARLLRTAPKTRWRARILARKYRLSTAAVIIGVSNGVLYALLGTWSYTNTLRRSVSGLVSPGAHDAGPMMLMWWLFLAFFIGAFVSALIDRRCALMWRPKKSWSGYFAGGVLMGFGVGLVPGGNDVLLLNAIPGFSPHALPAFVSMLVGIGIALMIKRRMGGSVAIVECDGDVCRVVQRK